MTDINPDTGEPSNEQRSRWARLALDAFTEEVFRGRTFEQLENEASDPEDPSLGDDYRTADQCSTQSRRIGWW